MTIDRNARLREIRNWDDYFHLTIDAPRGRAGGAAGTVGSVVKVADGTFPLLRRPLSIHDAGAGGIELFFKVAGLGTEILSRKKPGESLDLIGPLGQGLLDLGRASDGDARRSASAAAGASPRLYFHGRVNCGARGAFTRRSFYGGNGGSRTSRCATKFERGRAPELLCSTDDGCFGFRRPRHRARRRGSSTHANAGHSSSPAARTR